VFKFKTDYDHFLDMGEGGGEQWNKCLITLLCNYLGSIDILNSKPILTKLLKKIILGDEIVYINEELQKLKKRSLSSSSCFYVLCIVTCIISGKNRAGGATSFPRDNACQVQVVDFSNNI